MELKYIIVSPRNSSGGAKVLLNLYNIMDDLGLDVQMYLLDKVPTYKKNYFEYMLKFYLWTFVDIIKDRIKYSKMISDAYKNVHKKRLPALIQKKDADDLDFSSVFYFNFALCLILYAVMFVAAPFIAGLNDEIAKRKKVVERYRERLSGVDGIQLSAIQENVESNYAYFPVVFDGYKYLRLPMISGDRLQFYHSF